MVEAFSPYGVMHSVTREKWRCAGINHMDTLNREVHFTLQDEQSSSDIPHFLNIFSCRCLVFVPRHPPLCLRCFKVFAMPYAIFAATVGSRGARSAVDMTTALTPALSSALISSGRMMQAVMMLLANTL